MSNEIEIVGARTNNLQDVTVGFPLRSVTMVVGVSGSGKSSLLADTLATEINARMHRFLGISQQHLEQVDVPAFIGPVPPSIHFSQGAFRASSRTTVGTSSGLLPLLRLYFRRFAQPWSEETKDFVPQPSASTYEAWIKNHYSGPLSVWTVMARWERTDGSKAVDMLRRHGIQKARVRSETDTASRREQGRELDLEHFRPLPANVKHLIEAEIGKTNASPKNKALASLLKSAFGTGGDVIVEFNRGESLPEQFHDERGILMDSSQHWVHPEVLLPFAPPTDALLTFNSPSNRRGGACENCEGLARIRTVKLSALIAHPEKSMHKGALALWTEKNYRHVNIQHRTIEGLRGVHGFTPDTPWRRLGKDAQKLILYGSGDIAVAEADPKTHRKLSLPRTFPGFVPSILRRAAGSAMSARALESIIVEGACPSCEGTRWSREARALRLGKWSLPTLLGLSFDEMSEISVPNGSLKQGLPKEAHSLVPALHVFAEAFISAGLGHLSGDRGMTTLSEGESRRSRLAAFFRTPGQGLGLLLDEPARGLHESDVLRLANALSNLKNRHTLVINEHRMSLAEIADHVIELGPGGGKQGGHIVSEGTPQDVLESGRYLAPQRSQLPITSRSEWLTVKGAELHTVLNVDCRIPMGRLTCITGVSGSGKSTFIRGILLPALSSAIPNRVEDDGFSWAGGKWKQISGTRSIRSVLALQPRSPTAQRRSIIATLLGLASNIRSIFAKSTDARNAGLGDTDFGLNSGRGRCQTCFGLGEVQDNEAWVSCPHCGGRKFGEEVLTVKVAGLSIADLLDLSIDDLRTHPFSDLANWRELIESLISLDLGYLTLGRRIDRLSGGEHQRLRVAQTLSQENKNGLFLILDEPSAGLHPYDVARLLEVLDIIVGDGRNTVVLVEHNLDLIRASDWVIDFGPGGGPAGGRVVGEGPPSKIARKKTPTGWALSKKKPGRSTPSFQGRLPKRVNLTKSAKSATQDRVRSGHYWLKRLLGDEGSTGQLDPVDFEGLAVIFDPTKAARRSYEIAGLDIEIARLLLDQPHDSGKLSDRMAKRWQKRSDAHLQIHPLLEELRVWGNKIPKSVLEDANQRIKHMRLTPRSKVTSTERPAAVRATGERFYSTNDEPKERLRQVRDALGIGGGYVELCDKHNKVLMKLEVRKLDLEKAAVAPLSPSAVSLSRFHTAGGCPSCKGSGTVPKFDEQLVIAQVNADPTDERFLRREALEIIRGIRRNSFLPFFRRLTAEGLWPAKCPFNRLDEHHRRILLHGYWHRPGPGSFLKSPQVDPEEIGSWLKWDGLFRVVLSEKERSQDSAWLEQVEATSSYNQCSVCLGTGLHPQARAIQLGDRSFFDWIRKSMLGDFAEALQKLTPASERSRRRKKLILYCLKPIISAVPNTPLIQEIHDERLLRTVFDRVVTSTMKLKVIG